jgi:hypothetical protein
VGEHPRYDQNPQAEMAAENVFIFVLPSEARNLSGGYADEKKERFLASLGKTKSRGGAAACEACSTELSYLPATSIGMG